MILCVTKMLSFSRAHWRRTCISQAKVCMRLSGLPRWALSAAPHPCCDPVGQCHSLPYTRLCTGTSCGSLRTILSVSEFSWSFVPEEPAGCTPPIRIRTPGPALLEAPQSPEGDTSPRTHLYLQPLGPRLLKVLLWVQCPLLKGKSGQTRNRGEGVAKGRSLCKWLSLGWFNYGKI